jgi:hypothetical protein
MCNLRAAGATACTSVSLCLAYPIQRFSSAPFALILRKVARFIYLCIITFVVRSVNMIHLWELLWSPGDFLHSRRKSRGKKLIYALPLWTWVFVSTYGSINELMGRREVNEQDHELFGQLGHRQKSININIVGTINLWQAVRNAQFFIIILLWQKFNALSSSLKLVHYFWFSKDVLLPLGAHTLSEN